MIEVHIFETKLPLVERIFNHHSSLLFLLVPLADCGGYCD